MKELSRCQQHQVDRVQEEITKLNTGEIVVRDQYHCFYVFNGVNMGMYKLKKVKGIWEQTNDL